MQNKKLSIAIIDSGIDKQWRKTISNITSFYMMSNNKWIQTTEVEDIYGHGTACAYIIDKYINYSNIIIVKVFDDINLRTDNSKVVSALKLCMDLKVDIINMSFGMIWSKKTSEIVCIVQDIIKMGIVVVASQSDTGTVCWPAAIPGVYSVGGGGARGKFSLSVEFLKDEKKVKLFSGEQRVAWTNGKMCLVSGNSFACAKMTGIIAQYMENKAKCTIKDIDDYIFKLNICNKKDTYLLNKKLDIKKALIYPFTKEMHSIIRFRSELEFEIISVVDLPLRGNVGKEAGDLLGISQTDLFVRQDLTECLSLEVDTVILGDLSEISRIKGRSRIKEISEKAFAVHKNVCTIEYVSDNDYEKINQLAEIHGCKFWAVNDFVYNKYLTTAPNIRSTLPTICVLGTGPQVGKFTYQMKLKKILGNIGYKVSHLSTEPQSFLFGCDVFPIGNYNLLKRVSLDMQIDYLQNYILDITNRDIQSEILIVGGQSGVVPCGLSSKVDFNALSSWILLLAAKPDGVVLCANSCDDIAYIKRTITAIESTGYGKVILIMLSNLSKRIVNNKFGKRIVKNFLGEREMKDICWKMEKQLFIPVFSINNEFDMVQSTKKIIDHMKK